MDFSSPARKKRRRSTFVDRFRNDTTVLDGPLVKCKTEEIKEYLAKLSKEKKDWIEHKQTLHENYQKLKRLNSSEECVQTNSNYLDHLSKEDRAFLEMLNKGKDAYAFLCKEALPKMNENLNLITYEYEKQVEMVKQIYNNYELCLHKLQELICSNDDHDDFETIASQLASLNNDSTVYDEPFLFTEDI